MLTISNLNVTLDIGHPRPSDLDVYLTGPDNVTVQLFAFSGDNNVDTFDGIDADGLWTLQVIDKKKKKTGALNAWSITVESP